VAWYQAIVDAANCHLPYWSVVKRFRLINAELTVENGLLNRHGEIHRHRINHEYALAIASIYGDELPQPDRKQKRKRVEPMVPTIPAISCPMPPAATCDPSAQSLNPRFTA
jgi:long-chain acyl-CoA synthetase